MNGQPCWMHCAHPTQTMDSTGTYHNVLICCWCGRMTPPEHGAYLPWADTRPTPPAAADASR